MTIRNLDALFRPRAVWFLGEPSGRGQAALLDRLGRQDTVVFRHARSELPPAASAQVPLAAIVADSRFATAATITALGERGCRALLWPLDEPPAAEAMKAARAFTMRILGPRTAGLATPSLGLDLTLLAQAPHRGSLALITQSQSVAAAAVDWAAGRGIGFSLVAVVGGEADVDVADLLDYVALDRHTSAVAIELGAIRGARKFMSAARACARVKPTVVLQTRTRDDAGAGADPVRSAAFARAGLVEVPTLPGLFDALAALERLPVIENGRVVVASNGTALCGLAVDALIRQKLEVAAIPPEACAAIRAAVPQARFQAGAVDLGDPPADRLVTALGALSSIREADAVLYVRSPTPDASHEEVAGALAAGLPRSRLLTVWLGLESALPARRRSAEARQPTFTSPDAAARALRYRYEYSHNRVLLTQTPPRMTATVPDRKELAGMLDGDPVQVAAAYGVVTGATQAEALRLECEIDCHP
ncbi:MAG TPA: hypothetical protein VJM11_14675, partial [Nevskiaceae bacterium]|nr:hypothetical protein [Nevskiaceae bacterium]